MQTAMLKTSLKLSCSFIVGCFICLFSTTTLANQNNDNFVKLIAGFTTMQANFSQQIIGENDEVMQKSSGSVSIKRPNLLRWQTKAPLQQLIIVDDKRLWIYDIDLEQVTIENIKRLNETTPAMLLAGSVQQIQNYFKIESIKNNSRQEFKLTPKQADDLVQWVKLTFNDGKIESMYLFSHLNQVTKLKFKNVRYNNKLAEKLFKFKPPVGVDIINNY